MITEIQIIIIMISFFCSLITKTPNTLKKQIFKGTQKNTYINEIHNYAIKIFTDFILELFTKNIVFCHWYVTLVDGLE